MQLGVTLTSLGIGALGEATLSREFKHWMAAILAIVIAYVILSFFHVVFGELVPKGAALGHAEGTALWVSMPVRAFLTVFRPAIWLLQSATEVILHSFGLEPPGAEREVHSEAELRMLVSRSTQQGQIEEGEREMIDKVFVFGDKDVADVMVAKPDVAAISADQPPRRSSPSSSIRRTRAIPSTASRSTTSPASFTYAICSARSTTAGSRTCASKGCCGRRTSCPR